VHVRVSMLCLTKHLALLFSMLQGSAQPRASTAPRVALTQPSHVGLHTHPMLTW
jgi:hypothetical protein